MNLAGMRLRWAHAAKTELTFEVGPPRKDSPTDSQGECVVPTRYRL